MILRERQECLNNVFSEIEGLNRRRAFISMQYILCSERFNRTKSEVDKSEMEKYKAELDSIDSQAVLKYQQLRNAQTRYLVEYEGEMLDASDDRLALSHFKEELYFFVDCGMDTFRDGWDLTKENAEELLYEVADFLLQYRFTKFFIRNIKQL